VTSAIDIAYSDRACCRQSVRSRLTGAREQLSINAIIEMAAAARSIVTVGETSPRRVTTLSIPLSPDYRVAIDSHPASVHVGAHPCARNAAIKVDRSWRESARKHAKARAQLSRPSRRTPSRVRFRSRVITGH